MGLGDRRCFPSREGSEFLTQLYIDQCASIGVSYPRVRENQPPPAAPDPGLGETPRTGRTDPQRRRPPHPGELRGSLPPVRQPGLSLRPGREAHVEVPDRHGRGQGASGTRPRGRGGSGGGGGRALPSLLAHAATARADRRLPGPSDRRAGSLSASSVPSPSPLAPAVSAGEEGERRGPPELRIESRGVFGPAQGENPASAAICGGWWPTDGRCSTWGPGWGGSLTRAGHHGPRRG
jgi:hypothetical protein